MGKVLSPWCKQAKKAMIDLDMTTKEFAPQISFPYASNGWRGYITRIYIA